MTSFKQFLKEMPGLPAVDIPCAYKFHKGGLINANEGKYQYDSLAELMPKEMTVKMNQTYYYGKGPSPIICLSDKKIFMWDGKKGTYAPRTEEDITFCEEFLKALRSEKSKERNAGIDFSDATILTPEEEK